MKNYFVHPERICVFTNRLIKNTIKTHNLNRHQMTRQLNHYIKTKNVKSAAIMSYYIAEKINKEKLNPMDEYILMDNMYKQLDKLVHEENVKLF